MSPCPTLPWQGSLWLQLLQWWQRLPGALLLAGPPGTGKERLALDFARLLLCETPRDGQPCGQCPSCQRVMLDSHLGLRRMQPGDGKQALIGVEAARAIGDFLSVSGHVRSRRLVLVTPAEALTTAAANALLKVLEEPPPDCHFLLVSHESSRVLPTIRSRCQWLRCPVPEARAAAAWLRSEGVEEAELLLGLARGAPLRARELAYLQEQRRQFLGTLVQVGRQDSAELLRQANDAGHEWALIWLQQWIHDLLQHALAGCIAYNSDFAGQLDSLSRRAQPRRLLALEHKLRRARGLADIALNRDYQLEELLLDYQEALEAHG